MALASLLAAGAASGAGTSPQNGAAPLKFQVMEGNVAYLRVAGVTTNLPDTIGSALDASPVRDQLAGTVLDLRYADGDDSNAVAAAAHWFGVGKRPLAILVNAETRGAAAALAAELREDHDGLVFASAGAPIKADIVVAVPSKDEKAFWEKPYLPANNIAAWSDTNDSLPFVDHTSEADLVRAHVKDGDPSFPRLSADDGLARSLSPTASAPKPVIRDPLLARALDFIKGLAALGQFHS